VLLRMCRQLGEVRTTGRHEGYSGSGQAMNGRSGWYFHATN
jgi:hypothetical protein